MYSDLPFDQLVRYENPRPVPHDFDEFWQRTLAEHGSAPVDVVAEPYDAELDTIEVHDVTFAGYDAHPIRGWLLLPRQRPAPPPVIIEYLGYGGGRGVPIESLAYSAAGFAHFIMDTRGQGATTRAGDTADPGPTTSAIPGSMTKGITDREQYYFRRLYVDAVRAVDAVAALPDIDASRPVVTGRSQGGALSLVVAGLRDDIAVTVPHVPFLATWERALALSNREPMHEIVRWMKTHRGEVDQALNTLDYFDAGHFGARASCPGSFSVALMDGVCPPSTVYAAYNAYRGPKEITVYRYNDHEGGGPEDQYRTIRQARNVTTSVR